MLHFLSPILFFIGQLTLQNAEDRHVLVGTHVYPVPLWLPVRIAVDVVHLDLIILPLFLLILHVDLPRCAVLCFPLGPLAPLVDLEASIELHDQWAKMLQVGVHLPSGLILLEALPLDQVMHSPTDVLLAYYALNGVQLVHTNL